MIALGAGTEMAFNGPTTKRLKKLIESHKKDNVLPEKSAPLERWERQRLQEDKAFMEMWQDAFDYFMASTQEMRIKTIQAKHRTYLQHQERYQNMVESRTRGYSAYAGQSLNAEYAKRYRNELARVKDDLKRSEDSMSEDDRALLRLAGRTYDSYDVAIENNDLIRVASKPAGVALKHYSW